jgi:hypothetical protein
MRFQVPQFIEVEDKIFGPFTFKQFVYLAGGAGVVVFLFALLPKFLAFLISVPVIVLVAALTFFQINNRPFAFVLEAFIKYVMSNKLYVWKKEQKAVEKKPEQGKSYNEVYVPKLSQSRLKDLTWSLEVKSPDNTDRENQKTGSDKPGSETDWDKKLKDI